MIRFTCECGRLLQAREEQAGRLVACPACGRRQTVPDSSAAIQPGRAPASSGVRKGAAPAPAADEGAPGEAPAVTSGKATVSLVLGVLSFCALLLAGVPAALFGFLALGDIKKGQGRVRGQGLAMTGLVLGLVNTLASCTCVPLGVWLVWTAKEKVGDAAAKAQSQNNLKMIGLAMLNYHDVYHRYPTAGFRGPGAPQFPPGHPMNKPLLSWRVALLPFIEENDLYQQFHLNEPWDSPHNIKLLPRIPKVYVMPGVDPGPNGLTRYQVFDGPYNPANPSPVSMFQRPEGVRIADITDGTSNTILVVEAANGVPWTRPEDLPFDLNQPLPPLGGRFKNGFQAAFADASVRFIPKDTPEKDLKAMITCNGGEIVNLPGD
jgi:hypothetical protein